MLASKGLVVSSRSVVVIELAYWVEWYLHVRSSICRCRYWW